MPLSWHSDSRIPDFTFGGFGLTRHSFFKMSDAGCTRPVTGPDPSSKTQPTNFRLSCSSNKQKQGRDSDLLRLVWEFELDSPLQPGKELDFCASPLPQLGLPVPGGPLQRPATRPGPAAAFPTTVPPGAAANQQLYQRTKLANSPLDGQRARQRSRIRKHSARLPPASNPANPSQSSAACMQVHLLSINWRKRQNDRLLVRLFDIGCSQAGRQKPQVKFLKTKDPQAFLTKPACCRSDGLGSHQRPNRRWPSKACRLWPSHDRAKQS